MRQDSPRLVKGPTYGRHHVNMIRAPTPSTLHYFLLSEGGTLEGQISDRNIMMQTRFLLAYMDPSQMHTT
jgi:hypothetical protein